MTLMTEEKRLQRIAYMKTWRENNKGYDRERYLNNREQQCAYSREYYKTKRSPEQRRKYRLENRERLIAVNKLWREKNKERIVEVAKKRRALLESLGLWRERLRRYQLKYSYGLTTEQYDAMLSSQGGVCAICKDPPRDEKKRKLHVDHNHATGKIRGLLCMYCNHSLERLEKHSNWIENAATYLSEHNV